MEYVETDVAAHIDVRVEARRGKLEDRRSIRIVAWERDGELEYEPRVDLIEGGGRTARRNESQRSAERSLRRGFGSERNATHGARGAFDGADPLEQI